VIREQLASDVQLVIDDGRPTVLRFYDGGPDDKPAAITLLGARFPGAMLGEMVESNHGRDAYRVIVPEGA
jgi:hypothetical protein